MLYLYDKAMTLPTSKKDIYTGMALAVFATVIWSWNFIVARQVRLQIGPVSLAFYRWLTATIIIAPLAWRKYQAEKQVIAANRKYLFWTALMGITIFNTLVYVAGHYTTAINMALIGTTSSPIFATIMAIIFLKEKISRARMVGIIICIAGIVLLVSGGSMAALAAFRFSKGDLWVLTGAFSFAVYNILVRKKPAGISSMNFLFVLFAAGTAMLFPFYLAELYSGPPTQWTVRLVYTILYLGAGTSVIAFFAWNIALQKLGAGRTVLFGNLIPIFSAWEAMLLLDEKIKGIQLASGILVIAGLIIANIKFKIKPLT
jgi:drug/metabolite transporter (DMT)-like permease